MKNINLFNGDCYDILEYLVKQNIKFDAIICDPPFAITQNKNDKTLDWKNLWKLLYKLRKNTKTPIVLFSSELFTAKLINSNIENYKYRWFINKNYKTNHLNSKRQPLRQIDEVIVFGDKIAPNYYPIKFKGKPNHASGNLDKQDLKNNNYGKFNKVASDQSGLKYPTNLLEFDYGHPSIRQYHQQKPIKLMEYLVKTYTKEGETILDFTMGSGSTGIACVNLKRNFYGIEKDTDAFKLAKKRIEKNDCLNN